MGQQLFKIQLDINESIEADADLSTSIINNDNITFLFLNAASSNSDFQTTNYQNESTKQIRNDLCQLIKLIHWEKINEEINNIIKNDICQFLVDHSKKVSEEINHRSTYKKDLQTLLRKKLDGDHHLNASIYTHPFNNCSSDSTNKSMDDGDGNQEQQKSKYEFTKLSYFAIQSLSSILLILIKSAEKNDPNIIEEILTMTQQLCEQLPMKCLPTTNHLLFKSIKPLTTYIQDLSLSTNPIISKQTTIILLSFAVVKGSLIDILSLLNKLIFNTTEIYNVHNLFTQLNTGLAATLDEWTKHNLSSNDDKDVSSALDNNDNDDSASSKSPKMSSYDYLKSNGLYPNTELLKLNENLFTGQYLSAVLLSHIDIENQVNSCAKQLKFSSISCEFHPNTFRYLFNIIEQLSSLTLNDTTTHILQVCLRLLTIHLQLFCDIKSDNDIDLSAYLIESESKRWFELLLKLTCNHDSEQMATCKEASKALVYVFNIQMPSFTEKITLMHQYISENKYKILVEQLLVELQKNELLLCWINSLCDETQSSSMLQILYSFIDLYFDRVNEENSSIGRILFSFQQLLIYRLFDQHDKKTLENIDRQLPLLISQYLTYIFKQLKHRKSSSNKLFDSVLIGLFLISKPDEIFLHETIQMIFIHVLPLLADCYLANFSNEYQSLIIYLIGSICKFLIIGSPVSAVEMKHSSQLKSLLFAGGYITDKNNFILNSNLSLYSDFQLKYQSDNDRDFLLSIYNNVGDGEKLITKLKRYVKSKHAIQKSVEQQANDACAAVFAVYVQYYRRINLARYELTQNIEQSPCRQLLSIFEYAHHVFIIFSRSKAQGEDCGELLKQIRVKTLFLLTSVKESELIPVVNEQVSTVVVNPMPKDSFKYQRQHSRWSKARHILKLLKNLFQACIRFKKFMLKKKHLNEQESNFESSLHQAITSFLYDDLHKTSTSTNEGDNQLKISEIEKFLCQQHERALIRLITYRFVKTFLDNALKIHNNEECSKLFRILLPYLRENTIEWSFFDNVPVYNHHLKEEIGIHYYSIIKLALPVCSKSQCLLHELFHLLNLSYESIDLCCLYNYDLTEQLFKLFVSIIKNEELKVSLDIKLIAFNWFRLFVFKLSHNILMEKRRHAFTDILEKQEKFIFHILILNELKSLKQLYDELPMDTEEMKKDSLTNITIGWYMHAIEAKECLLNFSNKSHVEIYRNQYLVFLLQCNLCYEYILSICANADYVKELLHIYYNTQSNVTRLLVIKLLRLLIPYVPDNIDEQSANFIRQFLVETLNSIGENSLSKEIQAELIFMYRTIISIKSTWQIMVTQFLMDSMKLYLNLHAIELNNANEMNTLLATLCILGGYIEPYHMGSIVVIDLDEKTDDEDSVALIVEIDSKTTYTIQYLNTNKIESVTIDKIKLEADILPPNLSNVDSSILDILGSFIQIDTSTSQSLLLLQLKRRSIAVLHHILNNKKLIETFMDKSCASTIAKLCVSNSFEYPSSSSIDCNPFDKTAAETYALNLDLHETMDLLADNETADSIEHSSLVNYPDDSLYTIWNHRRIEPNPSITNIISTPISENNPWRSYASEIEIDDFRRGRIGKDEIFIVPMPYEIATEQAIQECGVKHRYRGRIAPTAENTRVSFPTFILDSLQFSEGNWYYCVRLPVSGVIQMGWATNGFAPYENCGAGDDAFSWSYDGSRATFFHQDGYYNQYDNHYWKDNDVCGCGIEINGKNTKIKYWVNGKLLGTAFEHGEYIPQSTKTCNLLPNGSTTRYYPCVTIQINNDSVRYCELILNPEDMEQCPLPKGYRPLVLPKLISTKNTLVDYPYHAYLIGENSSDYLCSMGTNHSSMIYLRDFIHEKHLQTELPIDNHHLLLSNESHGFPLIIQNDTTTSLTLSFDLDLLSSDDQAEILLFKFDTTDITFKKLDKQQQCAIIFLARKCQIKVYVNNICRTYDNAFQRNSLNEIKLNILPHVDAKIKNVAIWKYALSEDDIRRLFTYGLSFIAIQHRQLKDHCQQINTISFSKHQRYFPNEYLTVFNEPFKEDIWKKKKLEVNESDSIYFKTNDQMDYSVVDLYGNRSYLVLDKSTEEWPEYTFILDVSITNLPNRNEKLTLIVLNVKTEIYITSNGKICLLSNGSTNESQSMINLNEYVNIFVSVQEKNLQIYLNNVLEIDVQNKNDQFRIKSNRVELFKEIDARKNPTTNEETLRITLKSLTYLNRWIPITDRSLPNLTLPPFITMAANLSAMGYKKTWIQSTIEESKTTNIFIIHDSLFKKKDKFIKQDVEHEQQHYLKVISKLYPSLDNEIWKTTIHSSKFNKSDHIINIVREILQQWMTSKLSDDNAKLEISDMKSIAQHFQELDIDDNVHSWILDRSPIKSNNYDIYKLFDLNRSKQKTSSTKSIESQSLFSNENISSEKLLTLRIDCEHKLSTIYACYIMFHAIEIWLDEQSKVFPIQKLGDYPFLMQLIRLLSNTKIDANEKNNRIDILIISILKHELKQLLDCTAAIDADLLINKAPLFYHLQHHIFVECMQLLLQPSMFNVVRHQINEPSPDLDFILKLVQFFIELITDKTFATSNQIDRIIPILFPMQLINTMFNLFLLTPTHKSKIEILRQFSSLYQASEQFHLNNGIQQFLFQLLSEIASESLSSSYCCTEHFLLALADLVYILLDRQKRFIDDEHNHIQDFISKLPKDVQELFATIEAISAWMDPTKKTPLPIELCQESNDILGDRLELNQDEYKQSSEHFNLNADQELISLMNNDDSFSDFIEDLPTGTEADSTFYKTSASLSIIPANHIHTRAKFLYVLNKYIEKCFSIIDFSLPSGHSFLTDRIRNVKSYLLSSTKRDLFQTLLEKTETSYTSDWNVVKFNAFKAVNAIDDSGNCMFEQAFQQLHENAHVAFRRPNEQVWHAQYIGMHSSDHGGPYRDSITRMCSDLCSKRVSLFILCPNGRTDTGLNRDCWIPNVFPPHQPIPDKYIKQYRFVGQLFGLAIRKKHYLNLKFPLLLWKSLLNEPITIEDIEAIDLKSFDIIHETEKNIEGIQTINTDNEVETIFSSLMDELHFDVVSSSGETFELVPGGSDISINMHNFKHYCSCYRQYRLNEFNRQIEFIRQGLYSIIPYYYLSLFTAKELEEAICGKDRIDIELLKRNTTYEGEYNQQSPVIERFWTVLTDMFNDEQRKLFLIFVWGRSTLPIRDDDFPSKFIISPYDVYNGEVDQTLPRSHTCFFTLDLPAYSTIEVMHERLAYAISYCSSIDTDGTINNSTTDDADSDYDSIYE